MRFPSKSKRESSKEKDTSELVSEKKLDLDLPCPSSSHSASPEAERLPVDRVSEDITRQGLNASNHKQALFFLQGLYEYCFCHHVGVLLFSWMMFKLSEFVNDQAAIVKQWITTILLGAINIEQTKLLDFDALEVFFGKVFRNLNIQCTELFKMSTEEQISSSRRQ